MKGTEKRVRRRYLMVLLTAALLLCPAGCRDSAQRSEKETGARESTVQEAERTEPAGGAQTGPSTAAVGVTAPGDGSGSSVSQGNAGENAGPVLIFNTQSNENGELSGGERGDQTGREARIDRFAAYYERQDYPWSFIAHCTDERAREEAVRQARGYAANDNIGYDNDPQEKLTAAQQAERAGWELSAIDTPCSANCATAVLTIYKCAGKRLGIVALADIDPNRNVWEIRQELEKTGLFTFDSDPAHLHSTEYASAGDLHVAQSRHVLMQLVDGARAGR